MYEHSEFVSLVEEISKHFQLKQDKLHENIIALQAEGSSDDVVRMIYDSNERRVGFSFHVELMPTVAIQLFSYASARTVELNKSKGIQLLNCFFQDEQGNVFTGIDARYAIEQFRQDHYLQVFSNASDDEIKRHLKRIEDNKKKVTWH